MARKYDPAKAQQKLDAAHQLLQDGLSEFVSSDGWQRYLRKQAAFHTYSFRNVMLILSQNPDATHCAGYRTWQQVGRQVRKGEKGLLILAPMVFKRGDDDDDTYVRFKVTKTFDISQTDGEPLDEELPPSELIGGDENLYGLLKRFSMERGVPVEEELCRGGSNGFCRYKVDGSPDFIRVDPRRPLANRIKTLLHEIGYSLMHTHEGYRTHTEKSRIELEAESFAFMMSNYFGIDSSGYSFKYLASWSEEDDPTTAIQEIGKAIQTVAKEAIQAFESMVESDSSETSIAA
ncbi:MAG: ArdC-like ssDNA-binding domain-containing protein [Cyanobacteria bacterium P01_F01_bin.150]